MPGDCNDCSDCKSELLRVCVAICLIHMAETLASYSASVRVHKFRFWIILQTREMVVREHASRQPQTKQKMKKHQHMKDNTTEKRLGDIQKACKNQPYGQTQMRQPENLCTLHLGQNNCDDVSCVNAHASVNFFKTSDVLRPAQRTTATDNGSTVQ